MKKQYIQYDINGKNLCSVFSSGDIPVCERQLIMEPPVETTGMMVDLETMKLVTDPDYQLPEPTLSIDGLVALLVEKGVLKQEDVDAAKTEG